MTYSEQMQEIVRRYRKAGQPWPATRNEMAEWAINNGHWKPQPSDIVKLCATDLARGMREEYITDEQGRRVRAKHVATFKEGDTQLNLWEDIRTAPRSHMELAFKQRRRQIVGDCHQLKSDVDSYNQNQNDGLPIQVVFDFRDDLADLDAGAA